MKLGFSQQEIKGTLAELNLPEHSYYMRRAARALDIVNQDKVHFLMEGVSQASHAGEDVFRVDSQFDDTHYHVELNHGNVGCTCEDFKKNGVACKHMIAATIYSKQAKSTVKVTWDDTENSYHKRGRWWVTDYKERIKYVIYRDGDGKLICPCGRKPDCEHRKAIREYLNNNGGGLRPVDPEGNGSKITWEESALLSAFNECGSEHAKALQDKMNGQLDSQNDNGNSRFNRDSQPTKLDLRDPFQQSEQRDIDQIEGRSNGELVHKLSNGEYVISYQGIMTLSGKHHITFETAINDDTHTVIAKGRRNGSARNNARLRLSERVSGKPINGNEVTAMELAKRNCARQLLPLAEIKATECKAKLEAEFDWQKAQAKCVELVGLEANVDIIIHELVKDGKLRQDSPTHYDRTEWLIIHAACQKDAQQQSNDNDGGDKTPSSNEVNRYKVLADAPVNENWLQRHRECTKLVGFPETDLIISQELNFRYRYYKNKITNEQWDIVQKECRYRWNARQAKAEFASAQREYQLNHIEWKTGYDVRSKKYVGRPPVNSKEFIAKCQEAIEQVRAEKKVDANDLPLEGDNGKRKLVMDKKLKTWLVASDGTKTEISCREICERLKADRSALSSHESKQNPSIVTRLRAGIDDGADISVVELDN